MKLILILISFFLGIITQIEAKNFGLESNVVIDTRIVNGEDAENEEFPFQVSLVNDGSQWCSGSILNEDYVLTAAHCLVGITLDRLKIYSGTINVSKGFRHRPTELIVHANYSDAQYGYDIGLIKVTPKFEFSSSVSPAELPGRHVVLHAGTKVTVSGWGSTKSISSGSSNQLKKISLKVQPDVVCSSYYDLSKIRDSVVCTGIIKNNIEGECSGDSGGPVSIGRTVYGIVSFSSKYGKDNLCGVYPGVHTSTSAYLDWIKKNANLVTPDKPDGFIFPGKFKRNY